MDGSSKADQTNFKECIMNKMILLFDEFIMKAIIMTEEVINDKYKDSKDIGQFTDNRERLLSVIQSISEHIDWNEVEEATREDLNRKIEYIKTLDVKLLTKLQEHQIELKKEIESTFKQKENIKGYDLNSVK